MWLFVDKPCFLTLTAETNQKHTVIQIRKDTKYFVFMFRDCKAMQPPTDT